MRRTTRPGERPARPAVALAALAIAAVVGCRAAQSIKPSESLFPLEVGTRWTYDTSFYGPNGRSTVSEVAVCRVRDSDQAGKVFLIATCADGNLVQAQFVYGHGSEVAEPLIVNRDGDPMARRPPEVIARIDMRVGQEWTWEGTVADNERRSIYRVTNRGRVLTPAGEFNAVRLLVADESEGPPAVVERWYSPGVGLVKEAGVTFFPGENNQPVPVELVRLLKERSVVPVDLIACCRQVPSG